MYEIWMPHQKNRSVSSYEVNYLLLLDIFIFKQETFVAQTLYYLFCYNVNHFTS